MEQLVGYRCQNGLIKLESNLILGEDRRERGERERGEGRGREREGRGERKNNSRSRSRVTLAFTGNKKGEERKGEGKEEVENEHLLSTINSLNKYLINAFFVSGLRLQ